MSEDPRMLIAGELRGSELSLDVINPANGQILASVPRATEDQALEAVQAAKQAQPGWAALPEKTRKECLIRLADAIDARRDEIARTLVQEQGKPLAAATDEVTYAALFTRYFAEHDLPVEVVQDDDEYRIEVHHKPLGVVLGITPWNFPFLIPTYKLAPAVVLGNTFILKAAPTTPLCSMILAELAADIFPAGVVNVLTDDNDIGPLLTDHPDVAKVSFTGSTQTGRRIMEAGAATIKRLTLELGGNDAGIVLEDADIERTAAGVVGSAFGNSGQVCIALKRLYVPSSIYDEMCEALVRHTEAIAVGDGLEPGTGMGPMQNTAQFEKAKFYLDVARRDGKIAAGGHTIEGDGYFVRPTIVTDIDDVSPLVDDEQFSPILPVVRYDDLEAVIERVNASEYGLGGSIWSRDVGAATVVAHRIQSGTVWINHATHFGPHIPFGGAKQSGLGSEFAIDGMSEFTQKTVVSIAHEPPADVTG